MKHPRRSITAREAKQSFSQILDDVRQGASYVVTSHGKPVAIIEPVREDDGTLAAARGALYARLRTQDVMETGRWRRNELYTRQ